MTQKYAYDGSKARDDISALRASIYRMLIKEYGHLTSAVTLQALKDISEEMYDSGIDHALQNTKIADLDNIADAWDLTWLTALAIRLRSLAK